LRVLGAQVVARFFSSSSGELRWPYFGGAGVNPSRLWLGSGFGLGFGAFLASFLPLSLLPMGPSVTQEGSSGKGQIACFLPSLFAFRIPFGYYS
jgi:hypothetical protein